MDTKQSKLAAILAARKEMPKVDEVLEGTLTNLPSIAPGFGVLDEMLDIDNEGERVEIIATDGIDPRILNLSHSSRVLLHSCPRRYQLYKLNSDVSKPATDEQITKTNESEVTLCYGSVVGLGIQSVLEGKTLEKTLMDMFLGWTVDLLDNTPRHNKSFWSAVFAVEKFVELYSRHMLANYELVYYEGKPAVELSFIIHLPNEFKYRGFVDAVLQHKVTGEIIVLECKTTAHKTNPSIYKNSGQAIGYSIVLDALFPDLSSYRVRYLVYETNSFEYKQLDFEKSLLQRALWLQELLIDCRQIELYHEFGRYPMHGESCYSYFRDCEYISLCSLETKNITKPLTNKAVKALAKDESSYQFSIDFENLLQTQIEKGN